MRLLISEGHSRPRRKPYLPGCQVRDAGHAQQAHGSRYLSREDVRSPVHALLAAGHKPKEVGTSYEHEICTERHAGNDVGRSSIDVVPIVDRAYGIFRRAAEVDLGTAIQLPTTYGLWAMVDPKLAIAVARRAHLN
jgi:hypothetical protein